MLHRAPLTEADINKYCAIYADAAKLRKTSFQNFAEEYRKLLESHGMNALTYAMLSTRITTAMTIIDAEPKEPARDGWQQADVELVRKNLDRIKACMKSG